MKKTYTIRDHEADQRIDRWLRQEFPNLSLGQIQKFLRTGFVKVNRKKVKNDYRLAASDQIETFFDPPTAPPPKRPQPLNEAQKKEAASWVLYRDENILIINKPAGLASQGGTKQREHLDFYLPALQFDADEKPKLVHRLDKDTSGVMILARHKPAARFYTNLFKTREVNKLYWALVIGRPEIPQGRIDLSLMKQGGASEKMIIHEKGDKAITDYWTVTSDRKESLSWLAMKPMTGRMHQLRVHALALGCPIYGDGKYAGKDAFLKRTDLMQQLHLHAYRLDIPMMEGGEKTFTAPLPPHFRDAFAALSFDLGLFGAVESLIFS